MPFTPLHMGPGMFVKAAMPRHFSIIVFGLTQIVLDLEALPALHGLLLAKDENRSEPLFVSHNCNRPSMTMLNAIQQSSSSVVLVLDSFFSKTRTTDLWLFPFPNFLHDFAVRHSTFCRFILLNT